MNIQLNDRQRTVIDVQILPRTRSEWMCCALWIGGALLSASAMVGGMWLLYFAFVACGGTA